MPIRTSRFNQLIKRLETLTKPIPSTRFRKERLYAFSNEEGHAKVIRQLGTVPPIVVVENTIRVGILTGESSFCSLLPELSQHCDLIVFNDINPFAIGHNRLLLRLLLISQDPADFQRQYDQADKPEISEPKQYRQDLSMRKESLKELHFLADKARFQACQTAALKLRFAFSHVNLFNQAEVGSFIQCFTQRKTAITFFNISNLYEWDASCSLVQARSATWRPDGKVENIFNKLGYWPHAVMASSRVIQGENSYLKSKLFFDRESYFAKNEEVAKSYLKLRFQEKDDPVESQTYSITTFTPSFKNFSIKIKRPPENKQSQTRMDRARLA